MSDTTRDTDALETFASSEVDMRSEPEDSGMVTETDAGPPVPVDAEAAAQAETSERSRRAFLKGTLAAGAAGAFYWYGPKLMFKGQQVAYAFPPTGVLDPTSVTQYDAPLAIPPEMPSVVTSDGKYHRIAVRQFEQQILPECDEFGTTTVWSYGSTLTRNQAKRLVDGGTFFYPALTVEAVANERTIVNWRNELVDHRGKYLPHLFAVDPTLHWANPPGGRDERDTRPDFFAKGQTYLPLDEYKALPWWQRKNYYTQYTGPVPLITHVHGAHAYEQYDGYPEAWYLPDAWNIPRSYARTGTFFDYYKQKHHERTWDFGQVTFKYDNDQPATTLWYHDHALGITRLNVMAGPAAFWLIRGGQYDRDLGFVRPQLNSDPFNTNLELTEIPVAIQDRSFYDTGKLFYPDNRAFFEGLDPENLQIPFIGEGACTGPSDVPPIWNPEFFGDTMVVNGQTWPHMNVERRRYRFRFLNGCNSRFIILKLTRNPRSDETTPNDPDAEARMWQIGSDQSFLLNPVNQDFLLMAPAERADVIIDFAEISGEDAVDIYLVNDGPDEPFAGGAPGADFDMANHLTTGRVMVFHVAAGAAVGDESYNPATDGQLPAPPNVGAHDTVRQVSLNEESSGTVLVLAHNDEFVLTNGTDLKENCDGLLPAQFERVPFGPTAALCGTVDLAGPTGEPLLWVDAVTENPDVGSIEIWEIYNFTVDAHPIHLHLVQFQVLGRQVIGGPAQFPQPWERKLKDVVIAYPGTITRVKALFDLPGRYVWHCHIVEHEDNEMMRAYRVGPEDPALPHRQFPFSYPHGKPLFKRFRRPWKHLP